MAAEGQAHGGIGINFTDSARSIQALIYCRPVEEMMWVVFLEVGIALMLVLPVLWVLRPRAKADGEENSGEAGDGYE
jgi:hypothetical protein